MSNSSLVNYTKISPHRTSPRQNSIKKITIHHMAGNLSVETCGNVFQSREASSNYGIGSDGRVGMYVEEKDRSWCSSSGANDHQAVTIEVADDVIGNGWHSSDKAMKKLIELCVDICRRNGIKRLNYTGNTSGNLTMHKWFVSTDCPGAYLESKFPWIAEQVNSILSGGIYTPPASESVEDGKLEEDGSWGPATTRRTQQFLGTVVDGIVSNQPISNKRYLYSAHTSTWQFEISGYGQGSEMVRALQYMIGAIVDGWFGKESVMKLQAFLGVTQDASMGPDTVRAWQHYLNTH